MLQVIVFDIDDTLIATSRANAHCRSVALDLLEKRLVNHPREEIDRAERRLYKIYGWARMKDMWSGISRELNGRPLDEEFLDHLERRFEDDFTKQIAPLTTVVETLEQLRSENWHIGIISDGDEKWQMRKLDQSGLKSFFSDDSICISIQSDLRACKPSGHNFRKHEIAFNVSGRQLMYIGDKPWDVIGANNRGWISVLTTQAWADRENHWPEPELVLEHPDYRIETMAEILEVIRHERS